jgi:hypothetical protein
MSGPTTSAAEQAEVANMKASMAAGPQGDASSAWLDERTFPTVAVETGTYKYVLIHASDGRTERTLVRSGQGDYHKDVANTTVRALSKLNVQVSAKACSDTLSYHAFSTYIDTHTRTHTIHARTDATLLCTIGACAWWWAHREDVRKNLCLWVFVRIWQGLLATV